MSDMTSREETLRMATEFFNSHGLSVAPDSQLLKELGDPSGNLRAAVSRHWDSDDEFYADVLERVALEGRPGRSDDDTLLGSWQYLGMNSDHLATVAGRAFLLRDIIRISAEHNFYAVTNSRAWTNYVALSISSTLPAGKEERIREILHRNEDIFVDRMAEFYKSMMAVLGFQLKGYLLGDHRPLAVAAAALIEGLGIVRETARSTITKRFHRDPESNIEWSVVSIAFVGIVEAFVEPNPNYDMERALNHIQNGMDIPPYTGR